MRNTLYSYRRCPYVMRARMALFVAGIECDVHEIDFKNKPPAMLNLSPKGTVPVLVMQGSAKVIDESLDIMLWALAQNDPQDWLEERSQSLALIAENDGAFKAALDRYKYPNRFPDEDCSNAREQGAEFLGKLNDLLSDDQANLLNVQARLADIAIFPFIRQFANVDREWFNAQNFSALQQWLSAHLESDLFQAIFKKQAESVYSLI